MSRLLIRGAGGHSKAVLDAAVPWFRDILFLDDSPHCGPFFQGHRVFPSFEALKDASIKPASFVVAVGDNSTRARLYDDAMRNGWAPATLIHPSAVISPSARIGAGTVVLPRAVINACAEVGENSIINTGAIVEHDCRIGPHTHVSPGATLGGAVSVGSLSHVGLNATVLPGVTLGARNIIGAGAVVLSDTPDGVTAVGVPARIIR